MSLVAPIHPGTYLLKGNCTRRYPCEVRNAGRLIEALTERPAWLPIAPMARATTAISGIERVSSAAFSTSFPVGEREFPSAK